MGYKALKKEEASAEEIKRQLLNKKKMRELRGQPAVRKIPVIPYDPNTEANAQPEKRK